MGMNEFILQLDGKGGGTCESWREGSVGAGGPEFRSLAVLQKMVCILNHGERGWQRKMASQSSLVSRFAKMMKLLV